MSINVKSAGVKANGSGTDTSPAETPTSIIGALRARAVDQQKQKTEAFSVGGDFGDMLQIRYKPLEPDELDNFLARLDEVSAQKAIQMNMNMMAKACVAVEGVDEDGARTVLKDAGGYNILLDNRLMMLLDIPNESGEPYTSHEVITILFGNNGLAIGAHGDEVTEWMRDPKKKGASS